MIRAITFDFWRTLFRDNDGDLRQQLRSRAFAEAAGVSVGDVEEATLVALREFERCHREEQRTLLPNDAIRLIAQALGIELRPDVAAQLSEVFATAILVHPPLPIAGALDAVRAAAERYPVGVVCDSGVSPGWSLRHLLERHGFMEHIRALVFSDVVRVSKPQRAMFEAAAKTLGVEVNELLHIGDLQNTDIIGAQSVGAKAALFAGDNNRYLNNTTADYVFTSWSQFVAKLPEICATV